MNEQVIEAVERAIIDADEHESLFGIESE